MITKSSHHHVDSIAFFLQWMWDTRGMWNGTCRVKESSKIPRTTWCEQWCASVMRKCQSYQHLPFPVTSYTNVYTIWFMNAFASNIHNRFFTKLKKKTENKFKKTGKPREENRKSWRPPSQFNTFKIHFLQIPLCRNRDSNLGLSLINLLL